jgi:hypothetical protein
VIYPAGTPPLDLELAHLRENACRSNLTNYEIAARCANLVDTHGCTVASLSKHIGVPEGSVRALLSILSRLPPPIIEAWKNGAPELDRRTLQWLAGQPDYEAALSVWAERRAAFATASKGENGRRKRFRPPNARPTAQTLGRLCNVLRTSGRESFTCEEAVRIVEFAVGIAPDVPNIFTPSPSRRRHRVSDDRGDRELPLPEPGRVLDLGEPGFELELTGDQDDEP